MALLKRLLLRLFERVELVFDFAFGQGLNPFVWLGAFGWYFFWIVAGSGIYLYIFFDTGITNAYESVEYITNDQWYLAGVMRSLHRYASDALVVVVILHMSREFALDRLRGKHFFAWITGVPGLFFIYLCGISGYWLVWDQLAQYIAIATAEWLDSLPVFGEPIASNFLNSTTLADRFFTLMVFIHIFVPLFMLLLMWVHIQRHARARVNPPRPLAIGTGVVLVALSLVHPAVSQAPADLDVVPAVVGFDWFYLPAYPLLEVIPGGSLWLLIFGTLFVIAILPWVPPARTPPVAVVSLDNCNGCARCFADCPYSAIAMLPRSDGKAYDTEAVVNPDHCVSCGLCVGACPTATPYRRATAIVPGIELPGHPVAELREQTIAAAEQGAAGPRVLVYACEHSGVESLREQGAAVITLPCIAALPPSFVDFALSRRLAEGVMLAGCADGDCYHRLGGEWMRQRLASERDPYLRQRVDRERVLYLRTRPSSRGEHAAALAGFRSRLAGLPEPAPAKRRHDE